MRTCPREGNLQPFLCFVRWCFNTEFMNSILVFTSLLRELILSSACWLWLLVFELGEILSRVVPLQEIIFRLWLLPAVSRVSRDGKDLSWKFSTSNFYYLGKNIKNIRLFCKLLEVIYLFEMSNTHLLYNYKKQCTHREVLTIFLQHVLGVAQVFLAQNIDCTNSALFLFRVQDIQMLKWIAKMLHSKPGTYRGSIWCLILYQYEPKSLWVSIQTLIF